jgi:hypothetical protein
MNKSNLITLIKLQLLITLVMFGILYRYQCDARISALVLGVSPANRGDAPVFVNIPDFYQALQSFAMHLQPVPDNRK